MVTLLPPAEDRPLASPDGSLRTLVDELVAEQSQLQTPVARFAEVHDRQPDLADHYRNLIPLSKPGEGEQYAFEVELDRCTGCKACVSACHNLNGLDDHEVWRDTGTLVGGDEAPAWQQTVTTACHHCEDPGCLTGCPVGAYEKDADTGIVRHLDDQCIGCSYCILKCPYDVPKYSEARGIVRKCDMCHQRLAEGEAPACVQACPTEAIRIVKVATTMPRRPAANGTSTNGSSLFHSRIENLHSAIPSSGITRPTTRYVGRTVPDTAQAADRDQLVPQHAHWPLVLMLALTQAGVGLASAASLRQLLGLATGSADPALGVAIAGALLFNVGMVAAIFHLGQPLKAWRFFLGLRTSWLSREILAFSMYGPIPLLLCALPLLPDFPYKTAATVLVALSALPVGLAAVFTSAMIYIDTHRSLWRATLTLPRFFGTVLAFLALGLAVAHPLLRPLAFLAIAAKMLPELWILRLALDDGEWTPDRHSARLQLGPLESVTLWRFALAGLAAVSALVSPWLALPLLLGAAILERQLFFQCVQAPKMPGHFGPASLH